jgi:hypothetical protein
MHPHIIHRYKGSSKRLVHGFGGQNEARECRSFQYHPYTTSMEILEKELVPGSSVEGIMTLKNKAIQLQSLNLRVVERNFREILRCCENLEVYVIHFFSKYDFKNLENLVK